MSRASEALRRARDIAELFSEAQGHAPVRAGFDWAAKGTRVYRRGNGLARSRAAQVERDTALARAWIAAGGRPGAAALGARLGMTAASVYSAARRLGLCRPAAEATDRRSRILAAVWSGQTLPAVARSYGVSLNTVHRMLQTGGPHRPGVPELQVSLQMQLMGSEPRLACELAARLRVPTPLVSHALQGLVAQGAVRGGRRVGYRLVCARRAA